MNVVQRLLHRPFFIRLFNWEYWSFSAVYFCIYPVWFFLCLRARSFFFFAASNPGIKNGGFIAESKKDIIAIIPPAWHPKTVFFNLPVQPGTIMQQLQEAGLQFPLIGKPNVGGRGRGVKTLHTGADVLAYASKAIMDFHIQEYVCYPFEAGIFYYRYPGKDTGTISGIVRKEFLTVTGDGVHTMRYLLQQDRRAIMYLAALEETLGDGLDVVLPAGEKKIVSPYGNHARGSKFLDDSHLIDATLTRTIDEVCRQIPGFYYGRLDVRYASWDDLKQGKNFVIIEVNGAGSEPTHMYDPRHSLFFAWKEIVRHWIILWRISRMNHRLGHPYLTFREGINMFREAKDYDRKLAAM